MQSIMSKKKGYYETIDKEYIFNLDMVAYMAGSAGSYWVVYPALSSIEDLNVSISEEDYDNIKNLLLDI